jgi:hypothetical protein
MEVKPGIYPDIPFADYLQWDAVSNSRLGLAARSAAHYKQGFGDETTPSLRLGSLTHCGVLEPLQLSNRYVVEPAFASMPENVDAKGNRSYSHATTFVKEARKAFAAANGRKQIVTQAEYDKAVGIATSLHKENAVRALMSTGNAEVSLAWIDYATGLPCKCRIDWLSIAGSYIRIADLKTCRDPLRFENAIAEYGYHRQMAFYRRGIAHVLSSTITEAFLIAVETEAPYCSRTAKVSKTALSAGDDEVSELLELVAECKALDSWPGYSSPEAWELPSWKMRRNDDELVEVGEDI